MSTSHPLSAINLLMRSEAIRTCESLIFVMTRDSVKPQSVCMNGIVHSGTRNM